MRAAYAELRAEKENRVRTELLSERHPSDLVLEQHEKNMEYWMSRAVEIEPSNHLLLYKSAILAMSRMDIGEHLEFAAAGRRALLNQRHEVGLDSLGALLINASQIKTTIGFTSHIDGYLKARHLEPGGQSSELVMFEQWRTVPYVNPHFTETYLSQYVTLGCDIESRGVRRKDVALLIEDLGWPFEVDGQTIPFNHSAQARAQRMWDD